MVEQKTKVEQPLKLMNKNFILLWQGQLVSQIGSQAFVVALMFWTKHATGSATLMGMLMMMAMLPAVILGPIGGTFADRYPRRRIIVFSDVLNGIAVLSFAGVLYIFPGATKLILVYLFLVTIFIAVVGSFFRPAISAAIPDLVPKEKIEAANSMNQSSMQIALFIGQGLGGVLYRILGPLILVFADGLSYLFSAFSESFITIPQVIPENSNKWGELYKAFKKDTIEGFHYIWKKAGMRNLYLAAAFFNFFFAPIILLLPFYVEDFMKVKPDWYGYLLAAFGFGTIMGYLAAGIIKFSGRSRCISLIVILIAFCILFGSLGLVKIPIIALTLILIAGFIDGIFNIIIITLLQKTTPSEIRGRVFGLLYTLSLALFPIAMGLSGIVADLVNHNIPLIYITSGVILVILSIILSLNRDFRDFLSYEQAKVNF